MKKKIYIITIGILFLLFEASIITSISGYKNNNNEDTELIFQKQKLEHIGSDIKVDPDLTGILQNEISLEIIPGTTGQPSLLVAAYNDFPYPGGPGLGVSHSTNGGANWSDTHILPPFNPLTGKAMDDAFDPTVTIDTLGNVFVGHISSDSSWFSGMYVHKSTDGGASFLSPVTIALDLPPGPAPDPNFRFNDRCQITADIFSSSPYTDNIYVTWIKDRGFGMPRPTSDIYFSYSNDNGNSFKSPITINEWNNDLANMPVPAVASDGTIYISWLNYSVWTGGVGTIFLDKSTNSGVSWGTDINVTMINLPPLSLTTGAGLTDVTSKGAPVLKVSPTNPNELYITYAADPDGPGVDEADIFFIKSTNGGTTWGSPVRVNDDTTNNDQHLPWMDVKPDGTIDITWYDRRNDPNDKLWDVFVTRSKDGGNTFSKNIQINDQNFASPTNPWGVPWMGEYLGLAVDSTHAYIVFTTSVNDTFGDVYFDKIANTNLPLPEPDLNCDGDLSWTNVNSGATVNGSFTVDNIGNPNSMLDWEISEWPDWGVWTFSPKSGDNLPKGNTVIVNVTVVAPKKVVYSLRAAELIDEEFSGSVKIVNKDNNSDFCTIDVSMVVPVNYRYYNFPILQKILEVFPRAFSILRSLIV